jgi:hypothetical protein
MIVNIWFKFILDGFVRSIWSTHSNQLAFIVIVMKCVYFVSLQFNIKRYTKLLAQYFKNPILGDKHFKSVMSLW